MENTLTDSSYYCNLRQFKTGFIEMVVRPVRPLSQDQLRRGYESWSSIALPKTDKPELTEQEMESKRQANHARAVARAKAQIRFLCKEMGADRLFTLTYRENMTDRERLFSDFKRFLRLVRKELPRWSYVAVLEKQDRGAFHIHCAVKGYQKISILRRCWYRALGGVGDEVGDQTPGAVNVTSPKGKAQHRTWDTGRISGYLTKYLGKTFDESSTEKNRYWRARDLGVPPKTRFWLCSQNVYDVINEAAGIAISRYGVRPDFSMWLSDDLTTFWLSGRMQDE